MKQNINLYQPGTGSAGAGHNARIVLIAWAVTAFTVALAQVWLGYRNSASEGQLREIRASISASENSLNELTAAIMSGADPVLEAQLNEALRELDLRETILGLVSGPGAGDTGGFSAQMSSLARQQADGVWLTRVRISAPGGRTTLEGRALSPEAVPLYLQQLSGEAALAGQGFDVFEILRPEDTAKPVHFSLNRSEELEAVRLVRKLP